MSLNNTPSANRLHIGFFGRRNAGKSSLVNAITGQELAVVSDTKGTTTDPVTKAMELLPLGPVLIIDTPGFDDEGNLGAMRVERTKRILNKTDIAVLVVDATDDIAECDKELIDIFKSKNIPYLIAYNKSDIANLSDNDKLYVSALTGEGINELKEKVASLKPNNTDKPIARDLINPLDTVILITPIDSSAPKGRIILPQQQTLRDLLDAGAITTVVKETELKQALSVLAKKPALVITDSQVFGRVSKELPEDIPLTSFSILMARYKGFLETAVKGAAAIDKLKNGDTVLICEGCTHHRQCGDIGSVKIPMWLKKHTGAELKIKNTSGMDFPEDLSPY